MHFLNARAQVIAHTIFAQTLDIFGITVKRHYAARGSNKARGTECEGSQVRTHVVDDIAGVDHRGDGTLDFGLVLAAPEAGFLRDTQAHPQSQRETGLHLDPGCAAGQSVTLDEILGVVESGLPLRPTAKHRVDNPLLEREVGAIQTRYREFKAVGRVKRMRGASFRMYRGYRMEGKEAGGRMETVRHLWKTK